ncbi:MAG: TetR/AcrR family transcriptional regulator [Acidimicrobiales bacterium]
MAASTETTGSLESGPRAQSTRRRRQAILDAALECFSTIGYDQTTLADIRRKAGASTGSIYHHFGSKERIAASLYLDGLRQTQEAGLAALLHTRTARTGIGAQVGAYVDWVVDHPALATFLFAMRRAPFLDDDEPAIAELNTDTHERGARWIADRVAAGELPDLEPAMRWALVYGPCRHWAGSWLRGTTTTSPDVAKRQISTAVHAALQALI